VIGRALALSVSACLAAGAARADVPPEATAISLLTVGPGDELFARFGHTALVVQYPDRPTGEVFNFGTFGIPSPAFAWHFMRGRPIYWLSVSTLPETIAAYRDQGRSLWLQRLRLTPEARRALAARLRKNARPENADYVYDHYEENCTTRVRDLVDWATRGGLRHFHAEAARLDRREHTRRLTADAPALLLALDLALGPLVDAPISGWQEMFLPGALSAALARPSPGGLPPLADPPQMLFEARRPPELQVPPRWTGVAVSAGTGFGAALVTLALLATAGRRWARWTFGCLAAVSVSAIGTTGLLLFGLTCFTHYQAAAANLNVLCCAPWCLGLLWLARRSRATGASATRALGLVGLAVATSGLALALRVLGIVEQDVALVGGFSAPFWAGLAVAIAILHSVRSRAAHSKARPAGRPEPSKLARTL
jgi:hypothetical protein